MNVRRVFFFDRDAQRVRVRTDGESLTTEQTRAAQRHDAFSRGKGSLNQNLSRVARLVLLAVWNEFDLFPSQIAFRLAFAARHPQGQLSLVAAFTVVRDR